MFFVFDLSVFFVPPFSFFESGGFEISFGLGLFFWLFSFGLRILAPRARSASLLQLEARRGGQLLQRCAGDAALQLGVATRRGAR